MSLVISRLPANYQCTRERQIQFSARMLLHSPFSAPKTLDNARLLPMQETFLKYMQEQVINNTMFSPSVACPPEAVPVPFTTQHGSPRAVNPMLHSNLYPSCYLLIFDQNISPLELFSLSMYCTRNYLI